MSRIRLDPSSRDLLQHGAVLFIATSIVNLSNYFFHVFISRMLGPSSYGALGGILSLFVWVTICASALQLVVARHVATLYSSSGILMSVRRLEWVALRSSAAVAVVVALLSWPLSRFLHLSSTLPSLLLAAYVIPAVLNAVARGGLQGGRRFLWLAVSTSSTTLLRLGIGLLFVAWGWGVAGAVGGSVVSEILGLAIAFFPFRSSLGSASRSRQPAAEGLSLDLAAAGLAVGGFWGLVNMDTFLVRHYFSGDASGYYTAAATAARAILFFPAAIGMVAFPHFAARGREGATGSWMLTQSVVAVAVLSGSFALFLITFRHGIVSLLFGDAYAPGVRLITFLAVAMVLLAVVNVLVYFQLARRSRALWFLVPALAMEAVGIHLFHESLVGVACVLIATAAALLLCGSLAAKRFFWTRNGPDTDELRKAPAATR